MCTVISISNQKGGVGKTTRNLDPSMHATATGKTVELPTNVDAELLAKVLSNPEMAALLSALAKGMEQNQ